MTDAHLAVGPLGADERRQLLDVAAAAVRDGLLLGRPRPLDPTSFPLALRQPGAAFVTLRRGDDLLGCIGSMEPRRPLVEDVAHNAFGAAFLDPRLPSVTIADYEAMSIHISVLTPLEPVAVTDRQELRDRLRPHVDGLLIEAPGHHATFLPAVWEQVPDLDAFLDLLWRKAGLRPRSWPRGLSVQRYGTVEFGDDGPRSL